MFKADQRRKHLQERMMTLKVQVQFLCPKIACARTVGKSFLEEASNNKCELGNKNVNPLPYPDIETGTHNVFLIIFA
jgi:hypothetical protein